MVVVISAQLGDSSNVLRFLLGQHLAQTTPFVVRHRLQLWLLLLVRMFLEKLVLVLVGAEAPRQVMKARQVAQGGGGGWLRRWGW